ncbi:MAG: hypothetical protein QG657_795, partial [Acidobacteriota bacterium]|nr:hypothetical protein [Acidobacteriota bacterium]
MKKINILILLFSILVIGWSAFQYNSLLVSNYGKFTAYPQGKTAKVDFKLSELSEEEFTEREQMDQVRDWLLLGVLFNSGLDASSVNKITFDMPTNRYGYMKNISNLEYGETRSKFIGNGEIVALIPPCSKEEYQDYMAHIADEHRKNLDEIPKRIYVFQYEIDLDNNFALITRQEDQDGRMLFTEGAGYLEKKIDSLESLNNFMSRVDDITFARVEADDKLVVGGRKLRSRSYGRINVEDIAAIWQAEFQLEEQKKAFEDKWKYKTYRFESEREALIQQMKNEYIELKLPDHIGFSLDPEYNYPAIARFIRKNSKFLDKTFSEYGADTTAILSGLEKNDEGPLFDALQKIDAKDEHLSGDLSFIFSQLGNQKARYDGNLKGTEVGMHLFYTDLLAKLWAVIDFNFSAPLVNIPNFVSQPYVKVATIYQEESKRFNSCRFWFGPDNNKFQFAGDKNKVLFARNVSQIYAASSNSIYPGKEVPASAFWETSLNWWNNHFEEVAKYEAEYERLNEILKWSVVTSWLSSENKSNLLRFLGTVKVKRDNWFPDWVRSKKDLKFNQWDLIKFYPKNFMGSETEKMPILSSFYFMEFGDFQQLCG